MLKKLVAIIICGQLLCGCQYNDELVDPNKPYNRYATCQKIEHQLASYGNVHYGTVDRPLTPEHKALVDGYNLHGCEK